METEKLIQFLHEIRKGSIPPEAILDLTETLVSKLELLTVDKVSVPVSGSNRVYIAGDIFSTDMPRLARRYADAENILKMNGYKPLNPLQLIPEGTGWQAAFRVCLNALVNNCSYIAVFHINAE